MKPLKGGVLAGVVTPFNPVGQVDWASFERHIDAVSAAGVIAVVVNADTGEATHLSQRTREDIVRAAVKIVGKRAAIITGLIASYTDEAVRAARRFEQLGASGFQVFPLPEFLGDGVPDALPVQYFQALARVTSLPMMVYRTPIAFGRTYSIETLVRIAEVPGVTAIKESSLDRNLYEETVSILRAKTPRVQIFSGADNFLLDSLRARPDATVLAIAAVATERFVDIEKSARNDDWNRAEAIYAPLAPLVQALFAKPVINFRARIKEVLRIQGTIAGADVRLPLLPLDERERQVIRKAAEPIISAQYKGRFTARTATQLPSNPLNDG